LERVRTGDDPLGELLAEGVDASVKLDREMRPDWTM
jgi:hypothetical protein